MSCLQITPDGGTYIVSAGVEVACHIRQTSVEAGIVAYPSQGYQVHGYGASSEWGRLSPYCSILGWREAV